MKSHFEAIKYKIQRDFSLNLSPVNYQDNPYID